MRRQERQKAASSGGESAVISTLFSDFKMNIKFTVTVIGTVDQFVEINAMTDLPGLPFIDTVMTTIVFYGLDKNLPVHEAKNLIENVCVLLDETPTHAHIGLGEKGRKTRAPKFSTLDKTIAKGDFGNYVYIKASQLF